MRALRLATAIALLGLMVSGSRFAVAESQALLNAGHLGAVGVPLYAGLLSLNKQDDEGFKQLLYTYGASMGATLVLKNTIDATRPNGEPESFPSGHAASAFSGAAYLQRRYGWKYGAPAYAVGALVGYSRVENDRHYWRDVAASAVLSAVAAYFFTTPEEGPVVSVTADAVTGQYGVALSYRF